jgi:hypothetical protein
LLLKDFPLLSQKGAVFNIELWELPDTAGVEDVDGAGIAG